MFKKTSFLFIFVFSPLAFYVGGFDGSPEIDKSKGVEEKVAPKTELEEDSLHVAIALLSKWQIAKGTYYDPKDSTQTKVNPDGMGAFGRMVESGSIALGSELTKFLVKASDSLEFYVEIKNLNVRTPFGKGIFRLDDRMKYEGERFLLDFHEEDLSEHLKRQGRFKVLFRIHEIRKI